MRDQPKEVLSRIKTALGEVREHSASFAHQQRAIAYSHCNKFAPEEEVDFGFLVVDRDEAPRLTRFLRRAFYSTTITQGNATLVVNATTTASTTTEP